MAQNRTFNPYEDSEPGESAINFNVPQALGGSSGFPVGSTFKPFVLKEWLTSGKSITTAAPPPRGRRPPSPPTGLNHGGGARTPEPNPTNPARRPEEHKSELQDPGHTR